MTDRELLRFVDHTLLSPTATRAEIRRLLEEGIEYGTASVCIPPKFVPFARDFAAGRLPICTVIGFPLGFHTAAAKAAETENAVKNGADEIDMVIDLGALKEGDEASLMAEMCAVRAASEGKILKVIVETCLLTREEKIRMCALVGEAGADFIKTSTGFSTGGATFEDVELFREHVPASLQIKAAGGISTLSDAHRFLELGATRLGTSRIVKLIRQQEERTEK